MNKLRKAHKIVLLLIIVLTMGSIQSYASGTVVFGPRETKMKVSIKYSVIGRYNAQFESFQGKITVDDQFNSIQSVYLEIAAASIESECKWCDRIVRSDQLLAVQKYPKIIFTSEEIIKNKTDYTVMGTLEMHGVKRQVSFLFQAEILSDQGASSKILDIKGEWQIKRKDYKIIWNKLLDHGGVLVGDYITVDWGIKAGIKSEKESV